MSFLYFIVVVPLYDGSRYLRQHSDDSANDFGDVINDSSKEYSVREVGDVDEGKVVGRL